MIVTIIIAQGIIFLVLIVILRQFMRGHVSGAVSHLQKMNEELMKQQAVLKAKIVESEKEYKDKMNQLNQEISTKKTSVREEANKTLTDARETAQKEKEKLINEAVDTRERMRQEIMAEMEEKAIQHSQQIIAEAFTGPLRDLIHEQLIQDVVDGLNEIDTKQFQIKTDTAELRTAKALTDKHRKAIKKTLEDRIKKEVKFKEETDEGLVGGLILKFGTFVIDGSLTHRMQGAAATLKKATAKRYQKST